MARLERDASLRLDASALHPAETVASDVVRAALERLRPVDAEMLRLATWEELSHGEIAVIFRCSVNAVGVRLHRARQRLAVELEKDGMTSLKVTKGAHSAGLRPESDPVESASEWSS